MSWVSGSYTNKILVMNEKIRFEAYLKVRCVSEIVFAIRNYPSDMAMSMNYLGKPQQAECMEHVISSHKCSRNKTQITILLIYSE